MNIGDLFEALDVLHSHDAPCWVAGGWGVDVLSGRQTREHRDVDLALDAGFQEVAIAALASLGYRVETDQLPVRVELAAPGRRWIDLHPVVFDATGVGRQADLDGGSFLYPHGAFALGSLGGRSVRCLSVSQQLTFRTGYPLREVDHHDIAVLQDLRGEEAGRQVPDQGNVP